MPSCGGSEDIPILSHGKDEKKCVRGFAECNFN